MRTTDDGPDVRPAFCTTSGIVRGAWLTSRTLGTTWIGGDRQGAGTTGNACDTYCSWKRLRIRWSNPVNKAEEVCFELTSDAFHSGFVVRLVVQRFCIQCQHVGIVRL